MEVTPSASDDDISSRSFEASINGGPFFSACISWIMMKIDIWGKHKKNFVVVITDEKARHQQPLHPPTASKLQNIEYKSKSPMMIKFRMYF